MFGFLRLFSSKPSPETFSRLIIKEAAKTGILGDFVYNQEAFTLQHGSTRMYLGNVFAEYCNAKTDEHRNRLVTNFLGPLIQQETVITREAIERAIAVVRERALFSFMSLYWQLDGEAASAKTNTA